MPTVAQVQKHLLDNVSNIMSRESINAVPHFIPLDEGLLRKMLSDKLIDGVSIDTFIAELKQEILTKYGSKHTYKVSKYGLTSSAYPNRRKLLAKDVTFTGLLYENNELKGILSKNFSTAGKNVITDILNKKLNKYLRGDKFHAGHTEINSRFGGSLADTPVGLALDNTINKLQYSLDNVLTGESDRTKVGRGISKNGVNAALVTKDVLNRLNSVRNNFHIHAQYGSYIESTFSKEFSSALLSVSANVVLIQDGKENSLWGSTVESVIKRSLEAILLDINFSNNMREEATERVLNTLMGRRTNNTKKTVKTKSKIQEEEFANVTHGTHSLSILNPIGSLVNPSTNRKLGPSLASLQLIINQHLPHVIAANMGDQPQPGGQRAVLNYRTGRFANSAEVERLTMSKEGMVTAFYSYMKNPYATFSEGGMQYKPSRDPKKLIGEAIRDIARQYVGNRMRAVVV